MSRRLQSLACPAHRSAEVRHVERRYTLLRRVEQPLANRIDGQYPRRLDDETEVCLLRCAVDDLGADCVGIHREIEYLLLPCGAGSEEMGKSEARSETQLFANVREKQRLERDPKIDQLILR